MITQQRKRPSIPDFQNNPQSFKRMLNGQCIVSQPILPQDPFQYQQMMELCQQDPIAYQNLMQYQYSANPMNQQTGMFLQQPIQYQRNQGELRCDARARQRQQIPQQQAQQFKARPLNRNILQRPSFLPKLDNKKLTQPIGFNLQGERRMLLNKPQPQQQVQQFRAKPMPNFNNPFKPNLSERPCTIPDSNFVLYSELRAQQRSQFQEQLNQRHFQQQQQRLYQQQQQQLEEQEQIRRIRQQTVFRAKPCPKIHQRSQVSTANTSSSFMDLDN